MNNIFSMMKNNLIYKKELLFGAKDIFMHIDAILKEKNINQRDIKRIVSITTIIYELIPLIIDDNINTFVIFISRVSESYYIGLKIQTHSVKASIITEKIISVNEMSSSDIIEYYVGKEHSNNINKQTNIMDILVDLKRKANSENIIIESTPIEDDYFDLLLLTTIHAC